MPESKLKCQENDTIKKILYALFHNDQNPKELIDGKYYVQLSHPRLSQIFKGKYSLKQVRNTRKRLIASGKIEIKKPIQKNRGCFITFKDPLYERYFDKALESRTHKIPQNIIDDYVHNFKNKADERADERADENEKGKKEMSKPQEVKKSDTVYNVISKDITKKEINNPVCFSPFQKISSNIPTCEEDIRQEFKNIFNEHVINHIIEFWKRKPGFEYGYYRRVGESVVNGDPWFVNKAHKTETAIFPQNKHDAPLIVKKLTPILPNDMRVERGYKYLEIYKGNFPRRFDFDNPNFLGEIDAFLKKAGLPSLEKLGIITAIA